VTTHPLLSLVDSGEPLLDADEDAPDDEVPPLLLLEVVPPDDALAPGVFGGATSRGADALRPSKNDQSSALALGPFGSL
jgi:hypothetical protein